FTVFLLAIIGIRALEFSPGQLLIKTREPVTLRGAKTGLRALDNYLEGLGAFAAKPVKGMPSQHYFSVSISRTPDWDRIKANSLKFEGVEYIQPNYLRKMLIEPNDPLYPQQMHAMCSIPQAWNLSTGSSQVVVGVVDSGILRDHPDLAENVWYNDLEIPDNGIDDDNNGYIDDYCGWDFCDAPELVDEALGDYLDPDNDVTDENFHGTHVAGIIGAVGNNATGVSGVCWNVKIMPIRAGFRTVGGQGYLQDDDAAAALIYGADMGCRVINMSWGDPNYSPIIADACEYAASRGVILVASAGNDPVPILSYPARLSEVISVGAVNKSRVIAGFSSYGVDLDLVAPGEGVLSTYKVEEGEMYFEQNGTSMSSPYVVGGIALLLSIMPELSPGEVRSRLLTSCDDLGDPGVDIKYGHGLLNVRRLLENSNPPSISITNPSELAGISSPFEITGSIVGDDFFRYSVMRSAKPS
ncbi:MAG TPA: S8 family peptidase, partial [Candidatus Cloacimonadota bacterium]|nr:S8 family peptidase [Candidatus Cloacimonadota bacterium]